MIKNKSMLALGAASLFVMTATGCSKKDETPADFNAVQNDVSAENKTQESNQLKEEYMSVWNYIGEKGPNNIYPRDFKNFEGVQKDHDEDEGLYTYRYKLDGGELQLVVYEDEDGEKKVVELSIRKMNEGILGDSIFFIKEEVEKDELDSIFDDDEEEEEDIKDTDDEKLAEDDEEDSDNDDTDDEEDVEESTDTSDENAEDDKDNKEDKKEDNTESNDTTKKDKKDSKEKSDDKKSDKKPDKKKKDTTDKKKDEKEDKKDDEASEEKVTKEDKLALKKAQDYVKMMHMSKKRLRDQLMSEHGEGFSEEATEYALNNLKVDWKENALVKAKSYRDDMGMPIEKIKEQLMDEFGEGFTEEEAEYAVKKLSE